MKKHSLLAVVVFLVALFLLIPLGTAQIDTGTADVVPCEDHGECFKYATTDPKYPYDQLYYLCQEFPSSESSQKICVISPVHTCEAKAPSKIGGEICAESSCSVNAHCPPPARGKLECQLTTFGGPPDENNKPKQIPICVVIDKPTEAELFFTQVFEQCKGNEKWGPLLAGRVCRFDASSVSANGCYIGTAVEVGCACKRDDTCGVYSRWLYPISCMYNNKKICWPWIKEDIASLVQKAKAECEAGDAYKKCIQDNNCYTTTGSTRECLARCSAQHNCGGCLSASTFDDPCAEFSKNIGKDKGIVIITKCSLTVQTCLPPEMASIPSLPMTTVQPAPLPLPPKVTSQEQACTARKNMEYLNGKCICKNGFYNDLQLKDCITPQELKNQCDKIPEARFDGTKCICPKDRPYPSGFEKKCVTKKAFADSVCNSRTPGTVYDETKKTCVKGETAAEHACTARPNRQYNGKTKKCECQAGFYSDIMQYGCVSLQDLKNACNFPGVEFKDNKCVCKEPGKLPNSITKQCVDKQTYANAVCDLRKKGSIYGAGPPPTCVCPQGENADGSCSTEKKDQAEVSCECGEIINGECKSYKCCNNDACAQDEYCNVDMHECAKVICPPGVPTIIKNHECKEGCTDKKQCKDNEMCMDEKCVPIACPCGRAEDHICKPYECCDDSYCTEKKKVCDTAAHSCVTKEAVCYQYDPSTGNIKQSTVDDVERKSVKGLNLIIIPDRYDLNNPQQKEEFFNHVRVSYRTFFEVEPYRTFASKVNAYVVKKTENLGCHYNPSNPPTPDYDECDPAAVYALAENCPIANWHHGFVYVLTKLSPSRGAAHGKYAVANFDVQPNGRTYGLIHEASHLLGLADEYLSYNIDAPPEATPAEKPNCDMSPCAKWKDFQGVDCARGCTYKNWYRPKEKDTIMGGPLRELGTEFDSVSQAHLRKMLVEYAK